MVEFLLVAVIIIAFVLLGLLIFIWEQFNNTDSKLVKLIEDRIKLNNVHYELDRLEFPIVEEESYD
ncbi:MAG: hypothetical protein AB7U52_05495 [Candidatus Izemoplasmatales bacterium]